MDINQHILAVVEPEINPTEVKILALDEQDGGDKQTKTVGAVVPLVLINGFSFTNEAIDECIINMSGVLPRISLKLFDTNKAFGSDFMPRDGDCATVFINSKNVDTFKTIHMDFEIDNISSEATTEDGFPEISVSGITKIPRYFAEVCRSFENGTSLDHLELIARDLKIGLATNIESTDDSMPRLQAFTPTSDFIAGIVNNSYVSEKSFQRYHIDQFYYLNFIDVNKIFNSKNPSIEELQDTFVSLPVSVAEKADVDETADNIPSKLILTNHTLQRGSSNYIFEYKLLNNANQISLENGYERNISYYDNNNPDKKLTEINVVPQVSENLADADEPLKGRRGDDTYKEQIKFKYMGRINAGEDGLGNIHSNALYSEINNHQNNVELQKMKLKITLEEFNPSIYKYQKVPVLIYQYDTPKVEVLKKLKEAKKEKGLDESPIKGANTEEVTNEEKPNQMLDTFLSGHYVIENIDYKYSTDTGMIQEVTLLRREWPSRINALTEENLNKDAAS